MNTSHRAYSLLEVKSLDDDRREISGMATTPEPDRSGDIVEPSGAKFAPVIPLLWQHRHDMPIGEARLSSAGKAGLKFTASIAMIEEAGPLKDMVDMAWQAIKAKLVRGVSIGFKSIAHDYMSEGGIRFREYEIIELSAVTIPANAGATIQTVKALDMRGSRPGGIRLVTAAPPAISIRNINGAVPLNRS